MTDLDARRLLRMISILRTAGRPLTAAEIRERLPPRFRTHLRSIQRDLMQIRHWTPIRVRMKKKPYEWYWSPSARCPTCKRDPRHARRHA